MKGQPILIVRPRKKGHEGHHGGAWKVAYADFVTALMAFFLVMWLVGQDKSIRQAVAGYFRDPGLFEQQKAAGLLPGGRGLEERPDAGESASAAQASREALQRAAGEIQRALESTPDFGPIRDQIEIRMTADGLRIELQESTSSGFFDTGSAQLTTRAEHVFGAIAAELGKMPNEVLVEGHTDGRQYSSAEGYTNWELSADRANAVRRIMEKNGLPPRHVVEVRGYADTQLRNRAEPFDARNRRVSILVRQAK